MTLPRKITPGEYWFVSRRCSQRAFLLRPDPVTANAFRYCLAAAALQHGVEIVAYCAMSNHYHAVVRDKEARLPAFLRDFHRNVANVMNARWNRQENFWAPGPTSLVRCKTKEQLIAYTAYTVSNPVRACLVRKAAHWPGAMGHSATEAQARIVRRPSLYFSKRSQLPTQVSLRLVQPELFAFLGEKEWRRLIVSRVEAAEVAAEAHRVRSRKRLPSRKQIVRQAPRARPPRRLRRHLDEAVRRRRRLERAQRDGGFLEAYARALARRRAGDTRVVFPAGTYALRVMNLVRCRPFETD